MYVIDLRLNDKINCDNELEANGEPSHDLDR